MGCGLTVAKDPVPELAPSTISETREVRQPSYPIVLPVDNAALCILCTRRRLACRRSPVTHRKLLLVDFELYDPPLDLASFLA